MVKILERPTGSADGDDYFERGAWSAEMLANHPELSNIIPVNSGVAEADRYSGMRRHVVAPLLGFITTRNQMPPILP